VVESCSKAHKTWQIFWSALKKKHPYAKRMTPMPISGMSQLTCVQLFLKFWRRIAEKQSQVVINIESIP